MLCLKTSSGLFSIREPSGAERRPAELFRLMDNPRKTLAKLAPERHRTLCILLCKNAARVEYSALAATRFMGAVAV